MGAGVMPGPLPLAAAGRAAAGRACTSHGKCSRAGPGGRGTGEPALRARVIGALVPLGCDAFPSSPFATCRWPYPLTGYSTLESSPCTSPGQNSGNGSAGKGTSESASRV